VQSFYSIALFVYSINRIRQNASRTVIAVYFNPIFETLILIRNLNFKFETLILIRKLKFNANTTRQNGGSLQ
jgi:hypothetical protein